MAGPPGAGKGTICKMLAETLNLCHISVGDLLREYCTRTDLEPNPTIVQHVQDETLVPFDILKPVIFEAMERERARPNGRDKFLIDGFPRSIEQAVLAADAVGVSGSQRNV
jgi:adenylate kinase family enzyme